MNQEPTIEDILDRYIAGAEDKQTAVKKLGLLGMEQADDQLDLHYAAAVALQRYRVFEQVQLVHQQYVKPQQDAAAVKPASQLTPVKPRRWMFRMAAILLVCALCWTAYIYTNTNNITLYEDIYQPYTINTDRAAAEEVVPHKMISYFREGRYDFVINTFNTLESPGTREKFLAAFAFQQKENFKEAIGLYQNILTENELKGEKLYKDEAEFYLGLCYLKINNTGSALSVFEAIHHDSNHTYHERVTTTILTKLKMID